MNGRYFREFPQSNLTTSNFDVIGARRAPTDSLFLVGSSMIHAFRRILLIAFLPYVFCLVRRSCVPVTLGIALEPLMISVLLRTAPPHLGVLGCGKPDLDVSAAQTTIEKV
jgi:hypothetical protein